MPGTSKNKKISSVLNQAIGTSMRNFMELIEPGLAKDYEQVARRVTIQIIKKMPEKLRGGFKIGTGKDEISDTILEKFYSNINTKDGSGEDLHQGEPFYYLINNSGKQLNLCYHISAEQIKKYYNGRTSVPLIVLDSFCHILGSSLDFFMKWAFKDENEFKMEYPQKVQQEPLKNIVTFMSNDDMMKYEESTNKSFKNLWIVLDNVYVELNLFNDYPKIFKKNLERGVKYTYFIVEPSEDEERLRSKFYPYKDNLTVVYLSKVPGDKNYIHIPYRGYSIYDPDEITSDHRQGFIECQFYGMEGHKYFRMSDEDVEQLVFKLKKIKAEQEHGTISNSEH